MSGFPFRHHIVCQTLCHLIDWRSRFWNLPITAVRFKISEHVLCQPFGNRALGQCAVLEKRSFLLWLMVFPVLEHVAKLAGTTSIDVRSDGCLLHSASCASKSETRYSANLLLLHSPHPDLLCHLHFFHPRVIISINRWVVFRNWFIVTGDTIHFTSFWSISHRRIRWKKVMQLHFTLYWSELFHCNFHGRRAFHQSCRWSNDWRWLLLFNRGTFTTALFTIITCIRFSHTSMFIHTLFLLRRNC